MAKLITPSFFPRAAIFFDGRLPGHKRATRLDRMYKTSKQLHSYFLSQPRGIPAWTDAEGEPTTPASLFGVTTAAGAHGKGSSWIPAFAVPAVIEALRQSDAYGEATRLVPGEADPHCARLVRLMLPPGGLVLTSDSDLLAADLGPAGAVVFLRDVTLAAGDGVGGESGQHLVAMEYCPARIASRLGLPPDYGTAAQAF